MAFASSAAIFPDRSAAEAPRNPRWSGIGRRTQSPFRRGAAISAEIVKARARELGADLVGIASAQVLNAFPPDPRWPQTPERISPYVKSVIVIAQHIPAGAFRCRTNTPVQYMDMLVLRKMDKVACRLAEELERVGHPTFVVPAQETEWTLKRASYGRLSTRHLGVEAGLGTLGLEVNILTPEYGPRIYLTGVLTEVELAADHPMIEQVCIGESCSRCLYSCPGDAVLHFGIDKRSCAEHAQEFGFSTILKFVERVIDAQARGDGAEALVAMTRSRDHFGFWQGLLRVVGSFGDCPRCLAVCPVGDDYHAHLADPQKAIPEKTPEKVTLAKARQAARKRGEPIAGLDAWNTAGSVPRATRGSWRGKCRSSKSARRRALQRRKRPCCKKAKMVEIFRHKMSAAQLKAKARELGADLVGIADGEVMNANPPDPSDPRRPIDITAFDYKRVIVLAKHLNSGVARIIPWGDRTKFYNDELALSGLEEISLELVYWLEDLGYPAIIIPPTHVDPWRYNDDPQAHQTTCSRCRMRQSRPGSVRSASINNS
jgi:epoxyqueuosine reductase QueG